MDNNSTSANQNPLNYLKLFFRRKWLILAPLFAGFTLGMVAFFLVSPKYESFTKVLVEEQRTMNPLIQDLAVSSSVLQRLQAIRESILSWNNLAEMIKKLKLDTKIENQSQYEGLIKDLREKISVAMNQGNIIQISFQSIDPHEALLVTKTLTDNFIEENLKTQTKETDVAIEFIKEQLQVYKRKIKESEVNDLEEQLKKLGADSTEQHPMVRELKQKLDVARKALDSGEYVVGETKSLTDPVRQALKDEIDKLAGKSGTRDSLGLEGAALNDPNATMYKLLFMEKLDSAQARDINVNQRIYEQLLQRLETAKITQRLEASKQGTRYTILDPARLPLKPKKPQAIWVIIGLFLGLGAGVVLAFAREFLDHSFMDIEDAKQILELPVLGAISRITTQEEIAREKHREFRWIVTGSFAAITLITFAGLVSLFKK